MPAPPAAKTSGEKAAAKKLKAKENKAKANPKLAEANKASADAKRERRAATGSKKVRPASWAEPFGVIQLVCVKPRCQS